MQFEYLYTMQATGNIDIENIGDFAISVTNDMCKEWLMIVRTEYGICQIIQYGPLLIDFDELPENVNYNYQRMEYNEGKLVRMIDKFINDPSKLATQVTEISIDDATNRIVNMIDVVCRSKGE